MTGPMSRRQMMFASASAVAAATAPVAAVPNGQREPFRYCLNTSTIRGEAGRPIEESIAIAGRAGYTGIEPWIREIDDYVARGGSLAELAQRIRDAGLVVESAIAFPEWIVDDDARRARGMEEARRCMEIVAALGGRRIAAPPAGATDVSDLEPQRIAERYRALLELGERMGVIPMLEVWGFSRTLGRLAPAAAAAIDAGHPAACLLTDVYHLYRGGSDFEGLRLLHGAALPAMHMNDYPAEPPRTQLNDGHRVYPGDGVAPLTRILRILRDIGFTGALSLELFNRSYWQQDPNSVARTGLEKMRAAVRRALTDE